MVVSFLSTVGPLRDRTMPKGFSLRAYGPLGTAGFRGVASPKMWGGQERERMAHLGDSCKKAFKRYEVCHRLALDDQRSFPKTAWVDYGN